MLPPGTEVSRQLASERHVELKRDWQWVNPAQPDVVQSRRRRWRFHLDWLWTRPRPARHTS